MSAKEIEELLNELKRRNERYNYCKNNDISFSDEDYKSYLLLSCIEQLEKDKEILIRNNNIGNERLKELQNINKQLEKDNKDLGKENQMLKLKIKNQASDITISLQCNAYEELQQRCEKALNKLYCFGEVFDGKILQQFQREMENILNGGDEE